MTIFYDPDVNIFDPLRNRFSVAASSPIPPGRVRTRSRLRRPSRRRRRPIRRYYNMIIQ